MYEMNPQLVQVVIDRFVTLEKTLQTVKQRRLPKLYGHASIVIPVPILYDAQ